MLFRSIVYGSCKLLDLLGYGSVLSSDNTAKAAITQKYLGVDGLSDANNPLVYQTSQTVNALPFLAIRRFTMISIVILNGKSTRLTPIM